MRKVIFAFFTITLLFSICIPDAILQGVDFNQIKDNKSVMINDQVESMNGEISQSENGEISQSETVDLELISTQKVELNKDIIDSNEKQDLSEQPKTELLSIYSEPQEKNISRLGHIRNENVRIYSDLKNQSNYKNAGSTYTHAVYYIKKQADYNGELYYLISTEPSATRGVVGWVKLVLIKIQKLSTLKVQAVPMLKHGVDEKI